MYFIDQEHETNLETLNRIYKRDNDAQYAAHLYIAAVPEIFKLLKVSNLGSTAPLVTLMAWNEERSDLTPSHEGLTGSTTRLLELGMSLFNGHLVSLDYTPSGNYAYIALQAIKIRYRVEFLI